MKIQRLFAIIVFFFVSFLIFSGCQGLLAH